ncbi:MAG: hypothetical protein K8I82_13295 [Anaerolineae bacterium]|nr:hypothetical protein [Anaerolineae bacterium]
MHWKRVQQAIEDLSYNFQQFDLESLVRRIEDQRQRGITRIPFPFQPGLTGLWVPGAKVDYIFYDQNTHSLHQTHIILHELAHIVLGHRCQPLDEILPPELLAQLHGDSSSGRLRQVQAASSDDEQEQESELFVYLIREQIVPARRLVELTSDSSSVPGFGRFTAGMAFTD